MVRTLISRRLASALLVLVPWFAATGLAQPCATFNCGSQQKLNVRQGPNYHHVLPAGWTVGEEGQHALVLRSPDQSASIINFGLSGLFQPMTPQQLAYEMMATRMRLSNDIRFLDSSPIRPLPPYANAAIIDLTYSVPGARMRGIVISNVASVYQRTDGMITLVVAKEGLWSAYSDWLPPLAMLAINTGPDPYGRHSLSMTIQKDLQRLNQMASEYRDWSRNIWNDVAQFRARTQERQRQELGPMLTGQQWYNNPYGGPAVRQSSAPAVIWINPNGDVLPSDNKAFDPRTPTDPNWQRLTPQGR
jgi:hypothetical protein